MAEWCEECGVEIWAYCLMPSHVHLIASFVMDNDHRLAVARHIELNPAAAKIVR